jgi:hypothetical protein
MALDNLQDHGMANSLIFYFPMVLKLVVPIHYYLLSIVVTV